MADNSTPNASNAVSQEEEEEEAKPEQTSSSTKTALKIFSKHVVGRFLGLALYSMDIASDLFVAYGDYQEGSFGFAYLTLGFVFAPGVIFAIYMFGHSIHEYIGELACLKAPLWLLMAPILPFWPIVRDLYLIVVGLIATFSSSLREKLADGTLNQPSKAYLIRFTEAFAEAAPQLVIRMLKISLRNEKHFSDLRTSEIVQMSLSLLVLGVMVVSTHKKNISTRQIERGDLEDHPLAELPVVVALFAFVWWITFILARVEAMALFSASFSYWVFLIIAIHVALLFLFQTIAAQRSQFYRIGVYLIGAFLFIFVYIQFNLSPRIKIAAWFPYAIFVIVVFIENSLMIMMWYYRQKDKLMANLTLIEVQSNNSFNSTNSFFNIKNPFLNLTSSLFNNSENSGSINPFYNMTSSFLNSTQQTSFNGTSPYTQTASFNVTGELFNDTRFMNNTLTSTSDYPYDPEELQDYWQKLIYVHYIAFTIALVFMIFTFCCVPCFQSHDEEVEESELQERERLTSPS